MDKEQAEFAALTIATMLKMLRVKFTDAEILKMLKAKNVRAALQVIDEASHD